MTFWNTKDPAITPNSEIVDALETSLAAITKLFVGTKRAPKAMADRVSPVGAARANAAIRLTTRNAQTSDTYLKDLAYYETKALSTMGDVSDFKWFLPQLFGAHVDGLRDSGWYTLGIGAHADVFNKLERADFANWPERDSVEQFIDCFWLAILHTHSSPYVPNDFAENVVDLVGTKRLLDPWRRSSDDAAILQLAQSRVDRKWGHSRRRPPDKLAEYDTWLLSDDALEKIVDHEPKPGLIADRYDELVSHLLHPDRLISSILWWSTRSVARLIGCTGVPGWPV